MDGQDGVIGRTSNSGWCRMNSETGGETGGQILSQTGCGTDSLAGFETDGQTGCETSRQAGRM